MLELTSVVNFRDVGGHGTVDGRRVRLGVVYRSGHLGKLSSGDAAALERVPIRTVIDFRTELDISGDGGGVCLRGARRVHLPVGDPSAGDELRKLVMQGDPRLLARQLGDGQGEGMMIRAAQALVRDRREGFGRMLRHLADPGATPAILHCSAGKDRTGWAASLLLLIAGVPEETVVSHYAESDHHRAAENARILESMPEGVDPEWIRPFLECRPAYARASLEALRSGWGDVDAYVSDGLGVPEDALAALRDRLLDRSRGAP